MWLCVWSLSSSKSKTNKNKCITMVQWLFRWMFELSSTKMPNTCEHWLLGWWESCSVSRFLQKPNAVNLKEKISNAIKDLDVEKSLHLGMDEPSTNWNVLDLINDQVGNGFQKALGIGSCLFHILHGTFQTEMSKPGWDIGNVLKAFIRYLMSHLLTAMYIYVKTHQKYF